MIGRWRSRRAGAGRGLRLGTAPWLALAVLVLVSCNGTAPPHAEVLAATAAVREAEALRAETLANDAMASARSKLEAAKAALEVRAHAYARRSAEQSAVDAELAATQARAAIARDTADELRGRIEHLRASLAPRLTTSETRRSPCRQQRWALNAFCR